MPLKTKRGIFEQGLVYTLLVKPVKYFIFYSILLPSGFFPGIYLRQFFLPKFLASAGKRLWVYPKSFIHYPERLVVGEGVNMNYSVYIDASGGVEIGDYSGLGPFSVIMSSVHKHPADNFWRFSGDTLAPVRIGKDCMIGAGAVLLPGTVLEDGCIVSPNSVVSGSFPKNAIIVGNPARVTQFRKPSEKEELTDSKES